MKILRNIFKSRLNILDFYDILKNYDKNINFSNIDKTIASYSSNFDCTDYALKKYRLSANDVLEPLSDLENIVDKKLKDNKVGTAKDVKLIGVGLDDYRTNSVYLWIAVEYVRNVGQHKKGEIADFTVKKF